MNHNILNPTQADLLCLSHLRWDFVFQRPQHLMSRFVRQRRVFFLEEPVYGGEGRPEMKAKVCARTGVQVMKPHLPEAFRSRTASIVSDLLAHFAGANGISHPIAWFYTPMALEYFPESLSPSMVIYDCMDELSMFRNAPAQLRANEERLFDLADLVFTGGISLFEHKRTRHPHVYAFPSGVDAEHFAHARSITEEMPDQKHIPRPRLGYAGVIDERMDLALIEELARRRPDWHLVMIGPVVKIDADSLPKAPNLHWLGMKAYEDLPRYFAGWDVAIMPFALNDATRFISPTKTPEFLSAGLPVVSTPIRDVVRPYGELGLAKIAENAEQFAAAAEQVMSHGMTFKWRERADAFLETLSWDAIWADMEKLISDRLRSRAAQENNHFEEPTVSRGGVAHDGGVAHGGVAHV